jgi:hypothetical protein
MGPGVIMVGPLELAADVVTGGDRIVGPHPSLSGK